MNILEIKDLNAGYGKIPAVKDVSLRVGKGEVVAIIGANGAGKSTLLKAVSGLIPNRRGRVMFNGRNVITMPAHRIVAMGLSQVAEGRQIFSRMSVQDNIQLGAYLYHKRSNSAQIQHRISELYEMFPILGKRARQISGTLSGGEQQMLAIARALMTRPKLLVLDEPSMGLAPLIVGEIFNVIRILNKNGTTVLLVEQNARAALKIAHYGYVLETGRMVLKGEASDLLGNPKVKAAYLGIAQK
jgi:branched-chain amino acid transport system ATP-binding protein